MLPKNLLLLTIIDSSSLRSRRKRKAWGGARLCERNPRIWFRKEARARGAGGSAVARCTGSAPLLLRDPGVGLAKPRSTPGFMPPPASQASKVETIDVLFIEDERQTQPYFIINNFNLAQSSGNDLVVAAFHFAFCQSI